jgi:transposase
LSLYLDASALLPLFIEGARTNQAHESLRGNVLIISDFAIAEFSSGVARRTRAGEINDSDAASVFAALDAWTHNATRREALTPGDVNVAISLVRRLIQAPVAPHIIDKGIPTAGLLSQVLIAKYLDHAPLYRQESIFERAGLALPRSTLAQWVGACGVKLQPLIEAMKALLLTRAVLHADETPVPMLKPGLGRTHRAYLWSYSTSEYGELQAVVYDFADSRSGVHAREFLSDWSGKLVCDDYSGYKALFERGVTEVGCMAHARRKLHDLYANHRSDIAEEGLRYFAALYEIEREARELKLDADGRRQLRQQRSKPVAEALRQWLVRQRGQVPDGSATAKAIAYSLGRWAALIRYLDDGDLPIDNNHIENRIRPVALGRSNWLFAGSLRAGQRAATIMSLIQSAKLNGLEPYRYLKDVLERVPTQPASRLEELLPHRWQPTPATPLDSRTRLLWLYAYSSAWSYSAHFGLLWRVPRRANRTPT